MRGSLALLLISAGCYILALSHLSVAQQASTGDLASGANSSLLARKYREGEKLVYRMKAVNQGHLRTIRYEAQADGIVKKDASGTFVEEFGWSGVIVDGNAFPLSPGSSAFREKLSLTPNYKLVIPNVSQLQPILMGPVFDLLTFYADLSLAIRQPGLTKAGDHVYFKHGAPNSWADGTYTVLGEDSIDFDLTLQAIDRDKKVATVLVRHVPPAAPQIKLPAEWMKTPVADSPNNWVEVSKDGDGKYSAEIGKETFDVVLTVSLETGKLISAMMENPVEVSQRLCADAALSNCGDATRYQIMRKVSVD